MTGTRPREDGLAQLPTVAELFPVGSRRVSRRPGRAPALLLLPSRRSPRLLVPSDVPRAGAMLHRHSTTLLQRAAQDVAALAASSRLLPLLPLARLVQPDGPPAGETIEDHVREHVPGAARVGVLLGPPRANAKPVLRVFDPAGRTVAYGKVGAPGLAARLVRHEAEVLAGLHGSFQLLEVPQVLHAGQWRGLEVLFLSPLRSAGRRAGSWRPPLPAMRELAEAGGTTRAPVRDLHHLAALHARADGTVRDAPDLPATLGRVLAAVGDVELDLGRWHGDWAPWNTGTTADGRLQVWDWERSQTPVPVGLDVVHLLLQRAFSVRADPVRTLLPDAERALAGWLAPEQVLATVLLYLLEILDRYVTDAGPDPSPALRRRLATVCVLLARLTPSPRELRADA